MERGSEPRVSLSKRLIVCCDGTWEDGNSEEINNPLSNITRIARAIKPHAEVDVNGVRTLVPQITYYQKGVGTGVLDSYVGGLTGAGLSANVRAAYAFITENYEEGDELFFFGFSRGAYTARAVAGLVADMGLLTRRGMDNFPIIYNDYYKKKRLGYDEATRRALGFRDRHLPRFTIRLIGVFDTVGFHDFRITSKLFGEKFELPNTLLSPDVRYAFHALALDEKRRAFTPTLWHVARATRLEDDDDHHHHHQDQGQDQVQDERQELLQVWFSGAHADIGGGEEDPRLSNITLAWMIAHCSKDNQLEFDLSYLFADPPPPAFVAEEALLVPWATSLGKEEKWDFQVWLEGLIFGRATRSPMQYVHAAVGYTNEWVHESVRDRNINKWDKGTAKFKLWPSKVLARRLEGEEGAGAEGRRWLLKNGSVIREAGAIGTELFLKGRIRKVRAIQVDPA